MRNLFRLIYWLSVAYGVYKSVTFIFTVPNELVGKYTIAVSIFVSLLGSGLAFTIDRKLFSGKSSFTSGFSVPGLPDYYNFRQFNFKGINWAWQWGGGQIDNITAFCPLCCNRLETSNSYYDKESGHTWMATVPKRYVCDNDTCNFEADYVPSEKVGKEIERRINSGEYKNG
jgi:hypothetical protein